MISTEDFRMQRKIRSLDFDMFHPHAHEVYELYYLISGHCKMFVGHNLHYVNAGDLLLLAPGMLHRSRYQDAEPAERITINFSERVMQPFRQVCPPDYLEELLAECKITVALHNRVEVEGLLQKMEAEQAEGTSLSSFLAKNHLYELLAVLSHCRSDIQKEHIGATENLIQQAAQDLYLHFDKPLTLTEMAKAAHMTAPYFSRKFKQVTGFGFKEYLIYVRMAQAEKLLAQTSMTVTEIALSCGFEDGNYFGDSFKKIKGISPSVYRKRLLGIESSSNHNLNS
ncbi:MAG: AraC family transcriptional regulator [Hungatella sp.]